MNHQQVAKDVLHLIGGKENISHFEHCSTRLRFTLKDDSKVQKKKLEQTPGVMAVRMTAQCQVVIGNEVVEVYNEIRNLIGEVDSTDPEVKKKQKLGPTILDFIVGIFQPLIPAIAGGGILKSLLLLLALFGWMDSDGQTYRILNLVGDAPLYFLPLLVAVTTANKLKVNSLVALSAVGAMLLPNMSAMLAEGAQLFTFDIVNIAYAYQVFPAILTVLLYAQVEKAITKVSPKPIRIFFVPMMSLLITVPIGLLLLGPFGFRIGQEFASLILFIFEQVGWIAVGLLATVLPLMVATGMHKAMIPYAVTTMGELGKEVLYLPASLAHNVAESGACFAVAIRTKDKLLRATAISAGISALFGITEPALYGVTLQNKKVLGSVMLGSFVGGTFVGIVGLQAFVLVGPGLASLTMFISEELPRNILYAIAGFGISFVVAFVSAFLLGKDQVKEEELPEQHFADEIGSRETFKSPVVGQMISLEQVNDSIFSSRVMGDGIAIVPAEGKLYAPVDGTIRVVMDTEHAVGMQTENGADVLFHIGIDTVQLEGKYFKAHVQPEQSVKAGDLLVEFDLDAIQNAGFDPVTLAIVTNKDRYEVIVPPVQSVSQHDTIMTLRPIGGELT